MKSWKSLAVFAIVLVALIAALAAAKAFLPGAATPTATPTPGPDPLLKTTAADVASITAENPDGTITLFCREIPGTNGGAADYEWSVTEPASDYYAADQVSYMGAGLLTFVATEEISAKTNDLAPFGLTTPTVTVTVRLRDGTKHVVRFGDQAPGTTARYATLDDAGRVVLVPSSTFGTASQTRLDLLDKTLPLAGMTAENLETLEMNRLKDGLDIQFVLEGTDPKVWRIKSPLSVDADPTRLSTLIGEIVGIAPESYVEYEPQDLSKYGLDHPRYRFFLRSATGDVAISIGGDAGSGSAYFLSSAVPAVFKGSFSNLTTVDSSLVSLMSRLVYLPNIWDVARIVIDIDGKRIDCGIDTSKDQQGEEGKFTVNGRDATVRNGDDESYFRKFYTSVIDKSAQRLELDAHPADTKDITIAYTLKDATSMVLTFAKDDRDGYYVFKNGTYTGYVVSRDDFYSTNPADLGMMPTYDILANAMDHAVDGIFATPTPAPTSGG